MNNKLATIVILIVGAGVFAWAYIGKHASAPQTPEPGQTIVAPVGKLTAKEPASKLGPPLPDFPWEADAKFIDAGSFYSTGNAMEIVRTYPSKKTIAQNYKLFKEYFLSKNWKVSNESQSATSSSFLAQFAQSGKIEMKFYSDKSKPSIVEIREYKPILNVQIKSN
jgi:hypothetical protein